MNSEDQEHLQPVPEWYVEANDWVDEVKQAYIKKHGEAAWRKLQAQNQ